MVLTEQDGRPRTNFRVRDGARRRHDDSKESGQYSRAFDDIRKKNVFLGQGVVLARSLQTSDKSIREIDEADLKVKH